MFSKSSVLLTVLLLSWRTLNMELKECRIQKNFFVSTTWQYLLALMFNLYTLPDFKRSREEAAIMLLSWSNLYIKILTSKNRVSCFSNLTLHYLPELHV